MNPDQSYNDELKMTGHAYGYYYPYLDGDDESTTKMTCMIPLHKDEYENAVVDYSAILDISSLASIADRLNDSFAVVVDLMETIDHFDMNSGQMIQSAIESYIETMVRTVTHFETKLRKITGAESPTSFSQDVSEIYDNTDSYALLYKLRNVYQHSGSLPLRLERASGEDGQKCHHIVLDGQMILNKSASYLNAKVTSIIRSKLDIDIYRHIINSFDLLTKVMNKHIISIIDSTRAQICIQLINRFSSLSESVPFLLLTDLKRVDEAGSPGVNLRQLEVSLDYLCKLLSTFLTKMPSMLFSYWGNGISDSFVHYLPGICQVLGPQYYNHDEMVVLDGKEWRWLRKTLTLSAPYPEMMALLQKDGQMRLEAEEVDFCWHAYIELLKGVKVLAACGLGNLNQTADEA